MSSPSEIAARLETFLAQQDSALRGCKVSDYKPIVGGISRLMGIFIVESSAGKKQMVLRADPPAGTAILDSDRKAEWALLRHLSAKSKVSLPAALYFDGDGEWLGTPTILMDAIDGPSLTQVARASDDAGQRRLGQQLADIAASVHGVPVDDLPSSVARPDSWKAYMDTQIAQWSALEKANPGCDPFMRHVGAWLDANRPAPAPLCLVHGDLQISNVLVSADGQFSLIDWELAHIGDPREDFGWWQLVGAMTPPDLIGLDPLAFCARYRERTGLSEAVINPAAIAYFTVLSSLRVFSGIMGQAALLAQGKAQSTAIAYTVLVQQSIHRIWMQAIGFLDGTLKGDAS